MEVSDLGCILEVGSTGLEIGLGGEVGVKEGEKGINGDS